MAFPIANLNAAAVLLLKWSASTTDPILGNLPGANQIGLNLIYQSSTGATFPANQLQTFQVTLAAGATTTIDLTAARTNVLQQTSSTLARIMAIAIRLPSLAQSATLGSSASGVAVGAAASNAALVFGLTAGSSFNLLTGEMQQWQSPVSGGYPITPTAKNLQIVNNDAVNSASVLLAILGNDV